MKPIIKKRLKKYRQLANKGLWDIHNKDFHNFYQRAMEEKVELVSNDFNQLGMFRAPHQKSLKNVDIACVGLPMDIGVPNPRPGTRLAPKEVRYWSLDRNLVHYYTKVVPFDICNIIDWGDVAFKKDIYNLNANLEEIARVYEKFSKKQVIPLTIGGEHTCTYGILKGLTQNGKQPVALIHLDAHADTSVGFGGTRISDSTLFQCATVDGFIDPEKTIQVGLRGRGIPRSDFSYDAGMRVVLVEEFHKKGVEAIVKEARKIVGNNPCYLTIDTDVFDCSVMPGTTLPEPFGLNGLEVRDFVRGLKGLNLIGADLVELSPPFDPTGMSACLATGIAFEVLCILAEAKAERSGKHNPTKWA